MSDSPQGPHDGPASPEPASPRRRRRSGAVPILLIALGVLLLVVNVAGVDWRALLGAVELWPLLVIALGVDILTRGRFRAAVVIATIVVAALLWWGLPGRGPVGFGGAGVAETHAVQYLLEEAQSARIELSPSVGSLRLATLPEESDELLGGTIQTGRGEALTRSFDGGARPTLRLDSEEQGGFLRFGMRGGDRIWDLAVTRAVPLDLTLDTGVGETIVDLTGAQLEALRVDAGVGEVALTLPAGGGYDASVDAGVGEITVRLPTSVEARIRVDTGIGDTRVLGSFDVAGNTYTTAGYDEAEAPVDLSINGGIGEVTVERVP